MPSEALVHRPFIFGVSPGLETAKDGHHLTFAGAQGARENRPARPSGGRPEVRKTLVAQLEDWTMRSFDLNPLYRSTVGFDRMFNLLDTLGGTDGAAPTYPPYNIERTGENAYRVTMAVAGFGEDDLSIEAKENTLTVKGEKKSETEEKESEFLYRGIAARAFERRFQLADHVEVKGASLENGLLHIDLVREIPEAMKPRTIAIGKVKAKAKQIDAAAA
jgi:molecular chaperone IbpA